MRRHLMKALVGSGLVFGALTLGAQQYYPQQYQPRGEYQRSDRFEERNWLLNRVRTDLDNAESHTIPFTGDRWRIDRAKDSVNEFQRDLNNGHYDRAALDRAIDSMQRVVDGNRLPYRWQQALNGDMNRLRDLQSRMEGS
jgi:hypothetical protein